MKESDPQAPKIEFPCPNYPIKVMGDNVPHYSRVVIEIIERHAPGFDQTIIRESVSRNGRFVSLTMEITATGTAQLQAMFDDLKGTGLVKMVL
ncbi:hypothetical protein WH50_15685 [Pokkaliibacter plantistimulans]|uniref:UPF0250 protein WH50_15685 n=1 Tax=Pokkaliibacter plantistimulans TaxID=1635171 RepID=A0ABX5M0C1_9GAMM|nr:DUF493 family protein [Pokkaliibacter plantistimulans]PXF30375.1 hypothetical protein WH50_15685 [Pokkaliibacter plantistimulans]